MNSAGQNKEQSSTQETQGNLNSAKTTNDQEMQAELKNFEEYSKANNLLGRYDTAGSSLDGYFTKERLTGYPNPKLYDQFYINKYSFPKGLSAIFKTEEERNNRHVFKKSLYDIKVPNPRRGINGWKLTRRPHDYIVNQGPAEKNELQIGGGVDGGRQQRAISEGKLGGRSRRAKRKF